MALNLRVASPCSADWKQMVGDDRVRYCSQCRLNVYNFAAMSDREVRELVATHEGRLCGRLYRRADGTMLTRDCPVGLSAAVRRVSRVAGAALTAALSFVPAMAQTAQDKSSLTQIDHGKASVSIVVTDPAGAVIPGAQISIINRASHVEWNGLTNRKGVWNSSGLPLGTYELAVSASGFEATQHTIELSQLTSTVTEKLEVGVSVMGGLMIDSEPLNLEPQEIPNAVPDRIEENTPAKKNLFKKLISPFHHS